MKAGNFLCASALFAGAFTTTADIIARWTFETSQPLATDSASIGPIAPEEGTGSAYGGHASASTDWSNPTGNGSLESWSANTWAVGDYFEFRVSTVGFEDIALSWDQTRSGTGPSAFDLSYSLNGTDFTVIEDDYSVANNSGDWTSGSALMASQYAVVLSALDAIEQQPTVYFRLVADIAAGGTSGTVRVDNFTVESVPEAETSAALLTVGLGLAGWHLRRRMARRG